MSGLIPIEHKSQRVLTTQQVAYGYETEPIKIQQNFSNNRERYIQGEHYFILEGEELKAFKSNLENFEVAPNVNRMFLWTEKGAFLHAKSLGTDRAWEVYYELVDTYFRARALQPLSPLDALAQTVQILQDQDRKLNQLSGTVDTIKETIITQPDNWREDINRMINRIVMSIGSSRFREIRNESYEKLESRARVDLTRRLDNHKTRMIKAGASKTAIKAACKMDVIEDDPKLREIYAKIIQEYTVKYVA